MADEQEVENSTESAEKDDIYVETKPRPKIVRILTVLAYISSVSMAAILLSVYYVFMWDGQPTLARRTEPNTEPRVGSPFTDYHNLDNYNSSSIVVHPYRKFHEGLPENIHLPTNDDQDIINGSTANSLNGKLEDIVFEPNATEKFMNRGENDTDQMEQSQEVVIEEVQEKQASEMYKEISSPSPTEIKEVTDGVTETEEPKRINSIEISRRSLLYKKLFYKNFIMA